MTVRMTKLYNNNINTTYYNNLLLLPLLLRQKWTDNQELQLPACNPVQWVVLSWRAWGRRAAAFAPLRQRLWETCLPSEGRLRVISPQFASRRTLSMGNGINKVRTGRSGTPPFHSRGDAAPGSEETLETRPIKSFLLTLGLMSNVTLLRWSGVIQTNRCALLSLTGPA